MRKLKFRAWSKTLCIYVDNDYVLIDGYGSSYDTPCVGVVERDDDYIIEQCSGLKDKNDTEIYEGDIVKCYFYGRMVGLYQVIWNEDIAGLELEAIEGDPENDNIKDVRAFAEMHLFTRVIGNIHENPELSEAA